MMSGTNHPLKFYQFVLQWIPVLLPVFLFSCHIKNANRVVEPSFYYWKSVLKLSDFEKQRLHDLHIKTLYVKFFDVAWDASGNTAVPVAALQASENQLPADVSVVPVVFITNECIQKIDSAAAVTLAANIYTLIKSIYHTRHFSDSGGINEIQIDCDWTASPGINTLRC